MKESNSNLVVAITGECPIFKRGVLIFSSRTYGILLLVLAQLFFYRPFFAEECACGERLVKIRAQKENDLTHFVVENLQAAPVTVTMEVQLDNLRPDRDLPCTFTLPPRATHEAFCASPVKPEKESSWSYTYYATWGSMNVTHDDQYIYRLPYDSGASFPVSQGFNGTYSHTGPDQFAIDWKMPVGTPVRAARGGVVVGAKDDSDSGGPDKKYDWDANYVLIQHSDGTLGHYVHLKKGSNVVKVGQSVSAGDLLGYSGNTGHTTGPHLHFAVFRAKDGKHRETIPVKYKTSQSSAIVLSEGRAYKSI